MEFYELVGSNRSFRRFHQDIPLTRSFLEHLVDLSRHTASGQNLQPLKYYLSHEPDENAIIFEHLTWAGYLKDWDGPKEGERPSGYIIVLGDTRIARSFDIDTGISAQTILLGAAEKGFGGCILGSVKRRSLTDTLTIPDHLRICLVLALGKPKEQVVVDRVKSGGDIQYWRDEQGVHHVPKRSLEELIIN